MTTDTPNGKPLTLRPTTIHPGDWSQVVEAVKAGEAVVTLKHDERVTVLDIRKAPVSEGYIASLLATDGFYDTNIEDMPLTVFWQPASESAESSGAGWDDWHVEVYPGVDGKGFDIHSRNQGMGWRSEESAAYKWALGIANDNIATVRRQLANSEQEARGLREALEPFAEAFKEIPKGLRSTLRIMHPYEDGKVMHLKSANTDHLEAAASALDSSASERNAGSEPVTTASADEAKG